MLIATAAIAAIALTLRSFIGPIHSPLTAETIFAVCLVLSVIVGAKISPKIFPIERPRAVCAAAVLVGIALCFWGVQRFYFIGDDFFVVLDAVNGRGREFLPSLFHAGAGEIYYRPVGYSLLWISALACGIDPLLWHLLTLTIHLFNCAFLYAIALRLGLPAWTSVLAMAVFGIHGSRPESVVWTTGFFELVSTLFVLLSLYLYLRGQDLRGQSSRGRLLYGGALVTFLLALWCKESAFAFPLILIALPNGGESNRWRRTAPFFILAGAVFIHRFIVLGGVGGYAAAGTGHSEVAQFHALGPLKLLGGRLWSVLLFPINWEVVPGVALALATAGLMAVLLYCVRFSVSRRLIVFTLWATAVAALPASSQLLIGMDLQKSRLLYLPSVGFALFIAIVATAVPSLPARACVSAVLILFQFIALRHNIAIWANVSRLSRSTCQTAQHLLEGAPHEVTVVGLPGSIRGVYFFMNGFPYCLEMGDRKPWNVNLVPAGVRPNVAPGVPVLIWNGERRGLERLR